MTHNYFGLTAKEQYFVLAKEEIQERRSPYIDISGGNGPPEDGNPTPPDDPRKRLKIAAVATIAMIVLLLIIQK